MSSTTKTTHQPSALKRVLIALLIVLPVVGAASYMWAMWDPKAYLKDIPIAVVSEDAGVGEGKDFTNYGEQIADGMLDLNYLNFQKDTPQGAADKLERGEYMMVVTIPKDFSAKAATIIDENPVKPNINFELNDFYGTQSAFITGSLVPELQASVSQAVTAEYAAEVVNGLNELSSGLGEASDGAKQLDDGAGELRNGGVEAVNGIGQLKAGTGELQTGAGQLNAGAGELRNGAGQLATGAGELSKGMDELRKGTGELATGAGQINGGVKELTDMLIPILSGAQGPVQNLKPVVDILRATGMNNEANELSSLITDLSPENPENLVNQLNALRDGTGEMYYNLSNPEAPYLSGVIQLQDGAHQLRDGSRELAGGAVELANGTNELATGATQLNNGMTELNTGAGELKNGMDQLKDGTTELSTGLRDGAEQAPTIAKPDVSTANMSTPINFTQNNINPVQTSVSTEDPTATKLSGGVAILLVILFAFLGMAILAIMTPAVLRRKNSEGRASAKGVVGGWVVLAASSLAFMALIAVIASSMGWQPANWGPAFLVLALIVGAGTAVYQFLRTAFGHVAGGALIIATFAIGLFASGAVWPSDATPAPLRFIHILHPMGYARDAFVRASSGIYDGLYTRGITGLIVFLVLGVVASIIVHRFQNRKAVEASPASA